MPDLPPTPAALRRAVKRHVWGATHRFVATCALGAEELLAGELAAIPGVAAPAAEDGRVGFDGSVDAALAVLVGARIPDSLRVVLVAGASASDYPMLHAHLRRVRWPLWLPADAPILVRVRSTKSRVRDGAGIERSLRQAWRAAGIVGASGGPGTDAAAGAPDAGEPRVVVTVRLHRDRASVELHLGTALHRRARSDVAKWVTDTTIRETTAAALVRAAGAVDRDLIVDPFCGSGTLVAEARAAWSGTPAHTGGLAFEASPAWAPGRLAHALRTWNRTHERDETPAPNFEAWDADADAIATARHNLAEDAAAPPVHLAVRRAQDVDLAAEARRHGAERPLLLTNPPYGKGVDAIGNEPDALVRRVVGRAHGWSFAVLYPRPEVLTGLDGVHVDLVRPIVTSGLRNAMAIGRVDARP